MGEYEKLPKVNREKRLEVPIVRKALNVRTSKL